MGSGLSGVDCLGYIVSVWIRYCQSNQRSEIVKLGIGQVTFSLDSGLVLSVWTVGHMLSL